MSLQSILYPNNNSLYSSSLSTNIITSNSINTQSLTTSEFTTTNLVTDTIQSDSITLTNQRTKSFQCYYLDGFGNFQPLVGIFEMTIIRIGNFLLIDLPDIDVNLPVSENALIIANQGIVGAGPAILSWGENVTHNYNFNYILNIGGGAKEQAYLNIPMGLDEAFTIAKLDGSSFTGPIELYGQSFVVKVV